MELGPKSVRSAMTSGPARSRESAFSRDLAAGHRPARSWYGGAFVLMAYLTSYKPSNIGTWMRVPVSLALAGPLKRPATSG